MRPHAAAPSRVDAAESGFVLAWLAGSLVLLVVFAGFSVDIGHWYLTAGKAQKAADAAALAGVVFIPGDMGRATDTALELSERNGYDDGAADTDVVVERGGQPNQLRVTVSTTVSNFFIGLVGLPRQTISRTAVAEFEGPVPMGSPANNLGNQPIATGDLDWGSGLSDPESANPEVWAQIAGASTNKHNGDRFTANLCGTTSLPVYACSGSNTEYADAGYFYTVRVRVGPADVGKTLAVEIYDPAFVQSGDNCDNLDGLGGGVEETALRTSMAGLGPRYDPVNAASNRRYCPGDHYVTANGGSYPGGPFPTTTFQVFAPDATPWIDTDNLPIGACARRTYAPFRGDTAPGGTLRPSSLPLVLRNAAHPLHSYVRGVYHRWSRVCEVNLAAVGAAAPGVYDFVLQADTGTGSGHNRYAIRAGLASGSGFADADGTQVSVFANGRLPLYANAEAADTRFYLARVLPGNDNRTLSLKFYDVGDAAAAGRIEIVPPLDSGLTRFNGCRTSILPSNRTPSTDQGGCRLINVSSANYQAQLVEVQVPVPAGYDCDEDDPKGCWVRVRFDYPSAVQDTTTWAAAIVGDPVRLVE